MNRIKVIKKNDEYSLEYEIGDIFEVTGTWYGGVHINGRSGIPVSLDREEYRELEDGAKEQENEDESREAKPQARQGASVSEETIEKIRRFRDERDWRRNCWRYFSGAPGMCIAGRKQTRSGKNWRMCCFTVC